MSSPTLKTPQTYGHPQTQLHAPQALAASIARAAVEVSQRIRPLQQLQRWLTPQAFTEFQEYCSQLPLPQVRQPGIVQATVQRVRTYWVSQQAVECAAVIFTRGRALAVCLRLELFRGRWRVNVLEIVG